MSGKVIHTLYLGEIKLGTIREIGFELKGEGKIGAYEVVACGCGEGSEITSPIRFWEDALSIIKNTPRFLELKKFPEYWEVNIRIETVFDKS